MSWETPEALAQLLAGREEPVAAAAQDALLRRGAAAVPALCRAVGMGTGDSSWRAAYVLGRLGDRAAVPELCHALTEPPVSAIVVSIRRLTMRPARHTPRQSARMRREAAAALGRIGDPAAVPALSHALTDPHPEVSASAQRALIALGPAAVPRLCQLLYRGSTAVRELAAGALGAIGDPRAIEPLSHALAVDETPVRIAAARSLGQIADRFPAPELCQAVPTLRRLLTPWIMNGRTLQDRHRSRSTLQTALGAIESATRPFKDLPVPSSSAPPSLATLPVISAEEGGTDSSLPASNHRGHEVARRLAKGVTDGSCPGRMLAAAGSDPGPDPRARG